MPERKLKLTKKDVLKTFSSCVNKYYKADDLDEINTYDDLIDKYSELALSMGASTFEIMDTYFAATPEDKRQLYFEECCEKLWSDNDEFESFEEVINWADDMIKIRNKYNLQDPLYIEEESNPFDSSHIYFDKN